MINFINWLSISLLVKCAKEPLFQSAATTKSTDYSWMTSPQSHSMRKENSPPCPPSSPTAPNTENLSPWPKWFKTRERRSTPKGPHLIVSIFLFRNKTIILSFIKYYPIINEVKWPSLFSEGVGCRLLIFLPIFSPSPSSIYSIF
jgi:hypothetical protein